MNALVLGGNGFIGSHLVDSLLDEGHFVRVYSRSPEKYRAPLPKVDYQFGKIDDAFGIAEALTGIDIVFHLVSTTVPGTSNLDPATDIKDNLLSTIVVLEQMIKAKVWRIVFLSSGGTVYGNPKYTPINEEHPLNPICSYGVVKVAIENYLFMFQQLYGLQPIILRASNPFGTRQGHTGVQGLVSTFLNAIYNNTPLKVWGDGTVVRDYMYVTDLAKLCLIAGKSKVTGIYNVGYGTGLSVNQIIQRIISVLGKTPEIEYFHKRDFDVKEIVLDISKCKETFDWTPDVSIEAGISKCWEWITSSH